MGRRADATDKHVGKRARMRRLLLEMTQEQLAGQLGLTFQQLQKYEKGLNRVSASRLLEMSRALRVPIQFFFDGLPAKKLSPLATTTSPLKSLCLILLPHPRALRLPARSSGSELPSFAVASSSW